MDERTRQAEEERLRALSKRVADGEHALLNMIVREPKTQSEDYITIELEVDALETCLWELLNARQQLFSMAYVSTTRVLEKIEKVENASLTKTFNQNSGEFFKSLLRETRVNYSVFNIDNLLITMLWQLVFSLLKSSQDVETMRNVMKDFVPFMQKFKGMIETKEREPEIVRGIVESFWADLQKRGVVR